MTAGKRPLPKGTRAPPAEPSRGRITTRHSSHPPVRPAQTGRLDVTAYAAASLIPTRAENMRRLVGQTKNLNKAAAGRILGITGETAGQYLADESRWRDQIIERAERSRDDPSV